MSLKGTLAAFTLKPTRSSLNPIYKLSRSISQELGSSGRASDHSFSFLRITRHVLARDWSLITGRGGGGLQNGKIACPKHFARPPPLKTG